jgi:hypothetical protein
MRLHELDYCCHIYTRLDAYDRADVELRAATGPTVDPADEDHHAPLLTWLRKWGCRQFSIQDEQTSRASLMSWWERWGPRLPPPERTLDELDDDALDTIAAAYDDLRQRQAGVQRRATGDVIRRFGPTGAAKALYAIRPNCCSPWDADIRERLGRAETGAGYREHLHRARDALAEAVGDLGPDGHAAQLPARVDRPVSSPVKLVDEHDYARYTRGFEPPTQALIERWTPRPAPASDGESRPPSP